MRRYLLKRLLLMIPTLLGITLVVAALALAAPGEPGEIDPEQGVEQAADPRARSLGLLEAKRAMGFFDAAGNKLPALQAWANWLTGHLLRLDLGESFVHREPVLAVIGRRLPVTLLLNVLSFLLIYALAVPLGVYAATRAGRPSDGLLSGLLLALYSLPTWWVATMLLLLAGALSGRTWPLVGLHADGHERFTILEYIADTARHLLLPVVCLTYGGLAYLSRQVRSGMLEVLRQDYVRTARAKGLPERVVVWRHALRNALIPVVTLLGSLLPALLGGSVIVESIFGIPGLGLLSFEAIGNRDYPVVMAITLLVAVLTMLGLLLSDVLYSLVDPRVELA